MTASRARLAAVVLTGGTGARLGGADKASIEIEGRTLLEHALAATAAADEIVVVGAQAPTSRSVTWTREDPPGGGPAAGLLAGLDALAAPAEVVCALAVDMPRFTEHTLGRLLDALVATPAADADAACLVDDAGRTQWLAGVYRYGPLVGACPRARGSAYGLALRRLLATLTVLGVPAVADETRDVDTWADLRDLRGT